MSLDTLLGVTIYITLVVIACFCVGLAIYCFYQGTIGRR